MHSDRTQPVDRSRFPAFILQEGQQIVIGRGEEADIRIHDDRISRRHCRVVLWRGRLQVTDIGSTNGIFVASCRVEQAELLPGEDLGIGPAFFTFASSSQGYMLRTMNVDREHCQPTPHSDVHELTEPMELDESQLLEPVPGYQILEPSGKAIPGHTYIAHHVPTRERRYLKIHAAPQSSLDSIRVLRELEATYKLQHPCVASLCDFGEIDGIVYSGLTYAPGQPLPEATASAGALEPAHVMAITRALTDVLECAHDWNLVIRGLCPQHIVLGPNNLPMIISLAYAKHCGRREAAVSLSSDSSALSAYAAPELFVADAFADVRADIYSLGAIAYFALTGRAPFLAAAITDLRREVLTTTPPPIETLNPNVSHAIGNIIRTAMAFSADERFHNPAHLRTALDKAPGDSVVLAVRAV